MLSNCTEMLLMIYNFEYNTPNISTIGSMSQAEHSG